MKKIIQMIVSVAAISLVGASELQENLSFKLAFEKSILPEAARGSDKLRNPAVDQTSLEYIDGKNGLAALNTGSKSVHLLFEIKDNVDFTVPGAISMWISPINWPTEKNAPVVQDNGFKEILRSEFFLTSYSKTGYLVLQRQTSALAGRTDILMLVFPLFEGIKANKNAPIDFPLGQWQLLVLNWDGLQFQVYVNDKELFNTTLPRKIKMEELARDFDVTLAPGVALDEFCIYDRMLSANEIGEIFKNGEKAQ